MCRLTAASCVRTRTRVWTDRSGGGHGPRGQRGGGGDQPGSADAPGRRRGRRCRAAGRQLRQGQPAPHPGGHGARREHRSGEHRRRASSRAAGRRRR